MFFSPTLWQYGLWSFQTGGTKLERVLSKNQHTQYGLSSFQVGSRKLERFLPKNQHTQRKLLNFENWVNGEMSKIGHHFRK